MNVALPTLYIFLFEVDFMTDFLIQMQVAVFSIINVGL